MPGLTNSSDGMPPLAPSYRRPAEGNNYRGYYLDQQTVDHLMDSVHQGRMEDIRVGQQAMEIRLEDVQIVQGAIEVRARITPKPGIYSENSYYHGYLNPAPNYQQPVYSYPIKYPNQLAYQSLYQPPYQSSYPYQSPYLYQYQPQYPYVNPVVSSQCLPQFAYHYPYPNQFPAQYLYQYPLANVAGSIANAISQLALTTRLRR